jgi:hypothetical protein
MPKDPTIEEAKAHKRARPESRYHGPPMTLGNMRANGIRCLSVYCSCCHHQVTFNVDHMPDAVEVPSIGPRMVCNAVRFYRCRRAAELERATFAACAYDSR